MELLNKQTAFGFLFWSIAAMVLFPYGIDFMKTAEHRFSPVLSVQEINEIQRDGSNVYFSIKLRKNKECNLSEVHWTARAGNKSHSITVYNSSGEKTTGKPNLEKGEYVLGPFKAVLPTIATDSKSIHAVLWYDCHWAFKSKAEFGPIPIPEE
jgi:hypothetical protein